MLAQKPRLIDHVNIVDARAWWVHGPEDGHSFTDMCDRGLPQDWLMLGKEQPRVDAGELVRALRVAEYHHPMPHLTEHQLCLHAFMLYIMRDARELAYKYKKELSMLKTELVDPIVTAVHRAGLSNLELAKVLTQVKNDYLKGNVKGLPCRLQRTSSRQLSDFIEAGMPDERLVGAPQTSAEAARRLNEFMRHIPEVCEAMRRSSRPPPCVLELAVRARGKQSGFSTPAQLLYQIHNEFGKVRPARNAAMTADAFAEALAAAPAIAELPFVILLRLGKGRSEFKDLSDVTLRRIMRSVKAVARIEHSEAIEQILAAVDIGATPPPSAEDEAAPDGVCDITSRMAQSGV